MNNIRLLTTGALIQIDLNKRNRLQNPTLKNSQKRINNEILTKKIIYIQSLIRGWKTRNEIYLPNQIISIGNHLTSFSPEAIRDLTRVICIEKLKHTVSPENKALFVPLTSTHSFTKPGEAQRDLNGFSELFFKIHKDKNHTQVLLVQDLLDKGIYKKIYRAHRFLISKTPHEDSRHIEHSLNVSISLQLEAAKKGYAFQKEILKDKDLEVKIVELPKNLDSNSDKFQYVQTWFNGNLEKASKSNSVPLDFTPTPKNIPFTMADRVKVFIDVIKSLEILHGKGYVHRDIKTSNILIKLNDQNEFEGYLNDFDLTQKMGVADLQGSYRYWDFLSRHGLVYPSTDNYAIVISLAESLIPCFDKKNLGDHPKNLLNGDKFNLIQSQAVNEHVDFTFKAIKDHALDPLKQALSNAQTAKQVDSKFEEFITSHGSALNLEQHNTVKKLKNELTVVIKTFSLIKLVIRKHARLSANFNYRLQMKYKKFTKENADRFYENKLKPQLGSTTLIRQKIEELQTILQS